jgi:hypothetical protein
MTGTFVMVLFIYLAYAGAVGVAVLVGYCLWMLVTGRPRVTVEHRGPLPAQTFQRFDERSTWSPADERAAYRAYARQR